MSAYVAPLKDMRFVLRELAGLEAVAKLPGYQEATPDTVDAILEEASKFASEVLDPLNLLGDQEGSIWKDGAVATPKGFKQAYRQYTEGGWAALPFGEDWGGQGLPKLVATAVEEMLTSANMSFSLCPLLTQGAIHALELCGSEALKKQLPHAQAVIYGDAAYGSGQLLASLERIPLPSVADVLRDARTVVALEDVVDHTNVGAIFRSAAAFGAGAVLLDSTCADPLYRRSVRVSGRRSQIATPGCARARNNTDTSVFTRSPRVSSRPLARARRRCLSSARAIRSWRAAPK